MCFSQEEASVFASPGRVYHLSLRNKTFLKPEWSCPFEQEFGQVNYTVLGLSALKNYGIISTERYST